MRDSAGECLWYVVSGTAKDTPKTAIYNWDTLGQFVVQDADGNILAGATAHERPLALVLGPGSVLASQNRAGGVSQCGGNTTIAAYLDGADSIYAGVTPAANAISTLTLATASSKGNRSNNDLGVWISSKDIFDRVKKRSDFKADIDGMLGDLANCVNFHRTLASPPATSVGNKGVDTLITQCPAVGAQKVNVLTHWKENLLYTHPASAASVNGHSGCDGVLLFGGERGLRTVAPLTAQMRSTAAEKLDATMYLEGTNATLFPNSGNYTGLTAFNGANTSGDIVRCLKNPPVGGRRVAFKSALTSNPAQHIYSFDSFLATGNLIDNSFGVRTYDNGMTLNDNTSLLYFDTAGSTSGGCFWLPVTIPLANRILRLYYNFTFEYADAYAQSGSGIDRGNGFSLQMLRGDLAAPTNCGSVANMGVLDATDALGMASIFVETDVHQDPGHADVSANHTAIMTNGNLVHAPTNGDLTSACNGSAAGCLHTPANQFEESGLSKHAQRIEIHTGCDATCSTCLPASHGTLPYTRARISVWVDCVDCDDTVIDLDRVAKPPSINRCLALDTRLDSFYFGYTGGFQSGAAVQGVKIENLFLRSE